MRRAVLFVIPFVALSFLLSPGAASAAAKNQILANGVVKTVSATSLTVTAVGKDTTFGVDAKTNVVGTGIGTKSKAKGGKPTIADLLKAGDHVTVTYQEMGSMMHASKIQVTKP